MPEKFRIVITDFIADDLVHERQVVGDIADIVSLNAFTEEELHGKIEDADAIIMYHTVSITRNTLDRLRNCRLIVRAGVGIDNVDHGYAKQQNIAVANIPDYGSEDIADTAIGMMLALTRGVHYLNSRLRNGLGEWTYQQIKPITRLRNRAIGIVGLGRIGSAAALRAKALGMHVIFLDPFRPDGSDKALGISRAETLGELLRECQVISLHCPLTSETHHMINEDTLKLMRHGSYLINTSRGAVVDTSAIPDALTSGILAGAAFDVLEQEPPVDNALVNAWRTPEHPAHHRVIINPHAAFYSEEGLLEIRYKSAKACLDVLLGKPIRNVVN